ncbi:MAG: UPF0261 family protein, partial [Firmicutes bacterium]|nr:UPF0261 family protein [Bacillota bacterium]
MEPKVLLIATLDTKEKEAAYLKQSIEAKGVKTLVMDTGVLSSPRELNPDVSREEVALAGGMPIDQLVA